MLIDWFTVAAQALNFLILVWLLKRFLYKPILDAIDAREKRIATELADAEAKKAEARQERDEFKRRNEEFEHTRAERLNRAAEEATAERQRLIDLARKESDTLRTKWQEALGREHQNLSEELTHRTRDEVFAIARKALADLASVSLEEQMTDAFIHRLQDLSPAEKDALKLAFKSGTSSAIVRSTYHLPAALRRAIEGAVTDLLDMETQVQFETSPDTVSGIELTANGHKVAWSIEEYLSSLKKTVDDLLKAHPKQTAKATSHSES